jgi:hypothetical protein
MRPHPISRVVLLGTLAVCHPVFGQEIPPEQAIGEIQQSHIDANVPSEADFDRLLRRDLAAYFTASDSGSPEVSYDLLRKAPTQSGIAYPKFYAWVQVRHVGKPAREGAVRLAAIDRQRFEVLQFIDRSEISRDPSGLDHVFPPTVAAAIRERVARTAP